MILTADEEIGCIGAKHLAGKLPLPVRRLIIGEPTNLTPIIGGKGYGLAEIVVHGREAHSAFPERGHSAIRDACRVVERLDRVATSAAQDLDNRFDPPFTTINVGTIRGGTAKNVVPGECKMLVEWRPIPDEDPNRIPELIRREIDALGSEIPGFRADVEVLRVDSGFHQQGPSPLTDLLQSLTGRTPAVASYGTEAPHIGKHVSEAIVFGPGDMSVAHQTNEHISVEQLHSCTDVLRNVIDQASIGFVR